MIEKHPFEPFVPKGCNLLILGSFPGKESTQSKRYGDWFYGANRNQFWKILEKVYNQELKLIGDKKELLIKLQIGITDLIASCERSNDSNKDDNLINKKYNTAINTIIENNDIHKILFTGKGVFNEFSKNFGVPQDIELVVLPSPSPIYRRMSFDLKVENYKSIFPKL